MIRLFLDLDGVLHPQSFVDQPDEHLRAAPLLEKALAGLALEIVICSTWRLMQGLQALRTELSAACEPLGRRVVGVTPKCHALGAAEPRWAEIAHYQLQHGNTAAAALDDWDNYATHAKNRPGAYTGQLGLAVYHTDPVIGLQAADVRPLRELIISATPIELNKFHPDDFSAKWL